MKLNIETYGNETYFKLYNQEGVLVYEIAGAMNVFELKERMIKDFSELVDKTIIEDLTHYTDIKNKVNK